MSSKNVLPMEQPLFQPMGERHYYDSAANQLPHVQVHCNGICNTESASQSQQQGDDQLTSKDNASHSAANALSMAKSSLGSSTSLDGQGRATERCQPIRSWNATATRACVAQSAPVNHHQGARMTIEGDSVHTQSYTSPRITSSTVPCTGKFAQQYQLEQPSSSMNIAQHCAQQGHDFPPYHFNSTATGHVIHTYDDVLRDMQSMLIEMRKTLEDNKSEIQKLRQRLQEQEQELQKQADANSIKSQGESNNDFVFRAPTIEIDKYSGLPSEHFEFWLDDFLQSCDCMQLTSLQRLYYLPKVLTGRARRIYRCMPTSDKSTFEKAIAALTSKFGFENNAVLFSADLNVKQGENESVIEFAENLFEKLDLAHITSETDRMRRFFDGMRPEIKAKVLLMDCNSLEDTEIAARRAENSSNLQRKSQLNEVEQGLLTMKKQIAKTNAKVKQLQTPARHKPYSRQSDSNSSMGRTKHRNAHDSSNRISYDNHTPQQFRPDSQSYHSRHRQHNDYGRPPSHRVGFSRHDNSGHKQGGIFKTMHKCQDYTRSDSAVMPINSN